MSTYQVQTDGGTYEIETADAPGYAESFARGAGNNFPLAPQAIAATESLTGIGDEGGYSKNLADWKEKAAAAKEANPITYGAGAVTGAAAPLAIPGVGEALEASPVVGNAAMGAANAVSDVDVLKNPKDALKQGAEGALVGGALGKVGEELSSAVSSKASPTMDRLQANATANALDLGPYGVRKLAKGAENPEAVLNDIHDELEELLPGTIKLSDTAASKYAKLASAHDEAGQAIGSVIDSVTTSGTPIPEATEAIDELKQAASKYEGLASARNVDAKAELMDAATRLEGLQKAGKLNFENLSALKSDIGSAYHNPNLQNHGVDQAYAILSNKIDGILDRLTVTDPSLKPQFDQAKRVYKLTSNLLPAMKRGVSREVAGTGGGLTNAALGAGALFGHPVTAGVAWAGKTAAKLGAPDLGANVAYKGLNALRGASAPAALAKQGLTQEMMDYINSKLKGRK